MCPFPGALSIETDLRIISRIEWKKRKEILKAVYEEPREKRPDDSEEDERSPNDIDVDKIYTEHADELMKKERAKKGTKALGLLEHDVNMRSHRIIAGVYCIDYLAQPGQEVKIAKKSLLRTGKWRTGGEYRSSLAPRGVLIEPFYFTSLSDFTF